MPFAKSAKATPTSLCALAAALGDTVLSLDPHSLLLALQNADWEIATRVHGSSHSTLIGLLSAWWIRENPGENTVLDGAPSHGRRNAGCCDLMLCANGKPVGVVEVEGSKPLDKLKTLASYYSSARPEFESLFFGILLVYAYRVRGRGSKTYLPAGSQEIYDEAIRLSRVHPTKWWFVLILDKEVDQDLSSVRKVSPYYLGTTHTVSATALRDGCELNKIVLFDASKIRAVRENA